jgi:exonuclease III
LQNKFKRTSIFKCLKDKGVDVACLQETHVTLKALNLWEKQWGGKLLAQVGSKYSKGELILVNRKFSDKVEVVHMEERIQILLLKYKNEHINIVNVYAPNDPHEKLRFYKHVFFLLSSVDGDIVCCGDFNSVLNNELDIISGKPHNVTQVASFNEMVVSLDMVDGWRMFHKTDKDYTWNRFNPFIARRLDYCLLSSSLLSSCCSCEHVSVSNSDHKLIVVDFTETDFKRGPGYWRFNNSYLTNTVFVEEMNRLLDEETASNTGSAVEKWEQCKIKIRTFCSEFGKRLSCNKRNDLIKLQAKIEDLGSTLITDPNNEHVQKELLFTKQKLEIIEIDKAKGAQIRARTKWIEQGEKNTRFFCGLEKSKKAKTIMTRLVKDNGDLITNQYKILDEQKHYYENLYNQVSQSEDISKDVDAFLGGEEFPRLNQIDSELCEGLVTLPEAGAALRGLNNGSAPGYDGISAEFIKFFWNRIGSVIVGSFNESFENGVLSYSQRQGVITLIHKDEELDKDQLGNWRPITLTNTDYKLLAKILANRLSAVIKTLVNEDQVGYIKGRQSSSVIRTIDDVINYVHFNKESGYLLSLDFSKAFDSISKEFIERVFCIFGFGTNFRRWVSVLMKGNLSSINHGGWLSSSFEVNCGIRQGCPFSPLAFVLSVELMALKIRNSPIAGINIPSTTSNITQTIKIKQLADDATLFTKDITDINIATEIVKSFGHFSGLRLNERKSKVLKMGNFPFDPGISYELVDKIKVLGIYFQSNKMAKDVEDNYNKRLIHLQNLIRQWSKRDLSMHGKIVVIKTFMISQFTYVMQSVGLPRHILIQINTILYKFLWKRKFNNKRAFEKVKRKVLQMEYSQGGLNMVDMVDIQKSFMLQWMYRLHKDIDNNTFAIGKSLLCKITNLKCLCEVNCNSSEFTGLDKIYNAFWKNVFITFLDNKNKIKADEVKPENVERQLLFNNNLIRYKNSILNFPNWEKNGFMRLKDVLNLDTGEVFSLDEVKIRINQNQAITHFQYYAIINAIPKQWLVWLKDGNRINRQVVDNVNCNEIEKFGLKPKLILYYLRSKIERVKCPCVCFWQRNINFELTEQSWRIAFDVTKEIRLRELQWKILHNLYPTNIMLFKMGESVSSYCMHCPTVIDTLEHFFVSCPEEKRFWEYIEGKWFALSGLHVTLDVEKVLFGIQKNACCGIRMFVYLNHLILLGKMCISRKKKTNSGYPLELMFDNEVVIRKLLY